MRLLMTLLLTAVFISNAWAFTEDNTVGKPFDGQAWYSDYKPEYQGQKDRYCESDLRNDPEVLIAKGRESRYFIAKPEMSVVEPKEDIAPIEITTTWEFNK